MREGGREGGDTLSYYSDLYLQGFVVVTELKVLPINDKSPLGFLPLLHTMDDSKSTPHPYCVQ